MADIVSSLEALWKFDGDATDTTANGRDLTVDAGSPAFTTGMLAQAVTLDGTDGYVATGYNGPSGTAAFTIAGWVNINSAAGNQCILAFGENDGAVGRCRVLIAAAGHLFLNTHEGNHSYANDDIADEGWLHICITKAAGADLGDVDLYINGSLATASSAGSGQLDINDVVAVGVGQNEVGAQNIDGLLDDLRIYSRELSSDDVAALYAWRGGSPHYYEQQQAAAA